MQSSLGGSTQDAVSAWLADGGKDSLMAIGITALAGLFTMVGCVPVFFKIDLSKHKRVMSFALGFAAGIMTFISFAEVYHDSLEYFRKDMEKEWAAYLATIASFFIGVIIGYTMEFIMHRVTKSGGVDMDMSLDEIAELQVKEKEAYSLKGVDVEQPLLEETKEAALQEKMHGVGIMTAAAICMHKLPEGIITYMSYGESPSLGIVIAIGIALHNIPEGLSVALPIYYASKSKSKAALWTFMSSIAEPVGAVIAWLILSKFISYSLQGALFSLTGSIMMFISVMELIPSGHELDSASGASFTGHGFISGVGFIMLTKLIAD